MYLGDKSERGILDQLPSPLLVQPASFLITRNHPKQRQYMFPIVTITPWIYNDHSRKHT
ncbi:hypothetical protein BaRGS_00015616, partial [Batillaria attramentaria]